jgi:catechol 2,3-dioxygenase-like lactoylglutathione lyase family enzyme
MAAQTSIISGVDFVTVPTKDYEAAAKFYGEVLGLPFGKRWGKMPAGEFETGTLTIAVMQPDAFGLEFQPHSFPIELHVEDFEGAKAELESRGVEFIGEVIDSGLLPGLLQGPGRELSGDPPPLRAEGRLTRLIRRGRLG